MGETGRLARLRAAMEREDLDAVAMVPGANFYYLTGASFHLMERPTLVVVPREGPLHAVMPVLERSRWQAAAPEAETIYWQDSDGFDGAFARARRPHRAGPDRGRGPADARLRGRGAPPRLPGRRDRSTPMPPSRACACTRTRPRSRPCAGRSRSARRALAATLADAAAGMSETDFRAAPRGRDARRRRGRARLRSDRARRRRLRRPARHPEPRAPAGARASRCSSTSARPGAATWPTSPAPSSSAPPAPSIATSTRRCAPPTSSAGASPRRR